jgi:hypothetical protein
LAFAVPTTGACDDGPRSVADVLADQETLEIKSIDRMFCNLYVPPLQHVNGVVQFFRGHRGEPFASSALMDPISKSFVAGIHRYCRDRDVPMVDFVKGQRKDDVAQHSLRPLGLGRLARRVHCGAPLREGHEWSATAVVWRSETPLRSSRPPKRGSAADNEANRSRDTCPSIDVGLYRRNSRHLSHLIVQRLCEGWRGRAQPGRAWRAAKRR